MRFWSLLLRWSGSRWACWFFFKLRSLKHQAEVTLEALDAAAWKAIMQEEDVFRKNTPNEIRAAFGFPPITPTEYTEMKIREETDR